jgi:catechol 2,3-dioxygenase-like lactoylglutathione lyase family enzyme
MMQKVDAVALFVQDLDACTAFYRDTFHLPYLGSEPDTLTVFRLQEGLSLVLLSPSGAADVLGTAAQAAPSRIRRGRAWSPAHRPGRWALGQPAAPPNSAAGYLDR